jgi:hypothetical protein
MPRHRLFSEEGSPHSAISFIIDGTGQQSRMQVKCSRVIGNECRLAAHIMAIMISQGLCRIVVFFRHWCVVSRGDRGMDRTATDQDHGGHGSGIFYLEQIANSKFH